MTFSNWKPRRKTKAERRAAALEKRRSHYGGAEDWEALKLHVFQRDRWTCLLCPKSAHDGYALQAAHVVTVGMGGVVAGTPRAAVVSDPANIATLCVDCHRAIDQGTDRAALRERLRAKLSALYNRLERAQSDVQ